MHLNTPANSYFRTVFSNQNSYLKGTQMKKQTFPQYILALLQSIIVNFCELSQPGMNDGNITGCRIEER